MGRKVANAAPPPGTANSLYEIDKVIGRRLLELTWYANRLASRWLHGLEEYSALHTGDDIVQASFLVARNKSAEYLSATDRDAYLRKIMWNVTRGEATKARRRRALAPTQSLEGLNV